MSKSKIISGLILIVIVLGGFLAYRYVLYLRKAHSTFENYYAFRGCVQLIKRTSDYGTCETDSGQTIKIIKFNNRWYLDGDLPFCWNNICF